MDGGLPVQCTLAAAARLGFDAQAWARRHGRRGGNPAAVGRRDLCCLAKVRPGAGYRRDSDCAFPIDSNPANDGRNNRIGRRRMARTSPRRRRRGDANTQRIWRFHRHDNHRNAVDGRIDLGWPVHSGRDAHPMAKEGASRLGLKDFESFPEFKDRPASEGRALRDARLGRPPFGPR